jgi:hypothetical protein
MSVMQLVLGNFSMKRASLAAALPKLGQSDYRHAARPQFLGHLSQRRLRVENLNQSMLLTTKLLLSAENLNHAVSPRAPGLKQAGKTPGKRVKLTNP